MRLDHIPNPHPVLLRLGDVLIDVALRIDDRRLAVAADEIRRVREAAKVELFEEHVRSSQFSALGSALSTENQEPRTENKKGDTPSASELQCAKHNKPTGRPVNSEDSMVHRPHALLCLLLICFLTVPLIAQVDKA